jgi:hypothetical protein
MVPPPPSGLAQSSPASVALWNSPEVQCTVQNLARYGSPFAPGEEPDEDEEGEGNDDTATVPRNALDTVSPRKEGSA